MIISILWIQSSTYIRSLRTEKIPVQYSFHSHFESTITFRSCARNESSLYQIEFQNSGDPAIFNVDFINNHADNLDTIISYVPKLFNNSTVCMEDHPGPCVDDASIKRIQSLIIEEVSKFVPIIVSEYVTQALRNISSLPPIMSDESILQKLAEFRVRDVMDG